MGICIVQNKCTIAKKALQKFIQNFAVLFLCQNGSF